MQKSQPRSELMIYVEGLNVALAIWLIASPYILSYTAWSAARLTADFFGGVDSGDGHHPHGDAAADAIGGSRSGTCFSGSG